MRSRLCLLIVATAVLVTGGCANRTESSLGAGMRPAQMTGTTAIDGASSESPRYHRYDP